MFNRRDRLFSREEVCLALSSDEVEDIDSAYNRGESKVLQMKSHLLIGVLLLPGTAGYHRLGVVVALRNQYHEDAKTRRNTGSRCATQPAMLE
jgi:hypothetical protein